MFAVVTEISVNLHMLMSHLYFIFLQVSECLLDMVWIGTCKIRKV